MTFFAAKRPTRRTQAPELPAEHLGDVRDHHRNVSCTHHKVKFKHDITGTATSVRSATRVATSSSHNDERDRDIYFSAGLLH